MGFTLQRVHGPFRLVCLLNPLNQRLWKSLTGTIKFLHGKNASSGLRRFCDAMIAIRKEAEDVITGKRPKDNNLLKNAPHPMSVIALSEKDWNRYGIGFIFPIHSPTKKPE